MNLPVYSHLPVQIQLILDSSEDCHILDDWTLGDDSSADQWARFAGFALAAMESNAKKTPRFLDDVRVRRALALLVGVYCGIKNPLWVADKEYVAIVPIGVLRDATGGKLPGLDEFDLDAAVVEVLRAEHKGVNLRIDTHVDSGPGAEVLDLGGTLVILSRFAHAFDTVDANIRELVSDASGQMKRVPVGPSRGFVEKIGFAGPDGMLFAMPKPPTGGGIAQVLDSLNIKDVDRDIALLCNGGLSNKDIAAKLSIGTTTVQEHLLKLRSLEALRPYLPKQSAGRKPSGK